MWAQKPGFSSTLPRIQVYHDTVSNPNSTSNESPLSFFNPDCRLPKSHKSVAHPRSIRFHLLLTFPAIICCVFHPHIDHSSCWWRSNSNHRFPSHLSRDPGHSLPENPRNLCICPKISYPYSNLGFFFFVCFCFVWFGLFSVSAVFLLYRNGEHISCGETKHGLFISWDCCRSICRNCPAVPTGWVFIDFFLCFMCLFFV